MGRLEMSLKNVMQRGDRLYFRRKVAGKDTYIRLPSIDSAEFEAEYARLSAPEQQRARPAAGTMAALVDAYRATTEFKGRDIKTRINQSRYLDMIAATDGHRKVSQVRPTHVYIMRDRFADMPGKANNWLSVFRTLMKLAIRLDLRTDNPAADVPILAIGEHDPWPADLLAICLEKATPMTRLAIVTGLCSGQRVSDCIRMQYGWITAGIMEFTQAKRRKGGLTKDVAVPMHSLWHAEMAKLPRRSVTLLYERSGAPFKTTGAIQERLRHLMDMPEVREVHADLVAREMISEGATFTFHGLRKNACCYLLELGLSDTEVGSILGMSTEMVRHYGKRARALMIARGAFDRATGGTITVLAGGQKK